MGEDGAGSLFSVDGVVPSRMVGVSVTFSCTTKSRRFLLVLSHPGSPGKRAVKWLCVLLVCIKGNVKSPVSKQVRH